jgi:hypothetical protein
LIAGRRLAQTILEAEGVPGWILPLDRMATVLGFTVTLFVEARRLHRGLDGAPAPRPAMNPTPCSGNVAA